MLPVASSASAVVRIVMVEFLIAIDGESRQELTAFVRTMPLTPGVFLPR
jgi:hypothetical protein